MAVLSVAVSLLAPQPASASESGDVVFDGSGWGHGVGMSQYGAYGMSVLGSSHEEILTHYYQGASLTVDDDMPPLWVNLERDFSDLVLRVGSVGADPGAPVTIGAAGGLEFEAPVGSELAIATTADGCSVTLDPSSSEPFVLEDPECRIDFTWYDWANPSASPTTMIEIDGCTLADWNVVPTVQRPCQYARGTLHLRSGTDGLDLSVEL
ncbi:MAG TPA: hypothetical protein VLG28_14005, partial [Acidimicrobiia bacterium]|nr:hypothetical protein [Acidimicrobiia bacterium]